MAIRPDLERDTPQMELHVFITDGKYIGPITTIKLDDKTAKLTLQSSIERVINCSIGCIEPVLHRKVNNRQDWEEEASCNLEDWEEWKWPIVHLFNAVRNCAIQFYNRKRKPGE